MTAFALSRFRTAVALLAAAATLGVATTLPAQGGKKNDKGGAKGCAAPDDNGAEAMSGRLFLGRATDPKVSAEDKSKSLKQAVGAMGGKFDRGKDFGRDYLLGEALVLFATEPSTPTVGPRSAFGFKDDPGTQVDVLVMADTLLAALATTHPECAAEAAAIRQQAYVPLVNGAIQALNAGNGDSANALATRALSIYKESPYVYNVLGGVAVRKSDLPTAAQNYRLVIEKSGSDTIYTKLKTLAMYNLAVVSTSLAGAATGPDKKAKSDTAVALWRAYVAINPSDANGQAGLTNALQSSGDSASAGQLANDMVSNPSKYTDVQLFTNAVANAKANRETDAVRLFEAGLKVNPYYSEALYYVSNSYFNHNELDKLLPAVRRLVDVDPNNAENFRLLAGAYQLRAKGTTDPKAKKADQDSLVVALTKWKHPTAQVNVTKVVHDGDKMEVAGTVQNTTAAAKTFALKIQFLDASGKVLTSQDVPPASLAPQASAPFDVSVTQPGVIAYKYLPLE